MSTRTGPLVNRILTVALRAFVAQLDILKGERARAVGPGLKCKDIPAPNRNPGTLEPETLNHKSPKPRRPRSLLV